MNGSLLSEPRLIGTCPATKRYEMLRGHPGGAGSPSVCPDKGDCSGRLGWAEQGAGTGAQLGTTWAGQMPFARFSRPHFIYSSFLVPGL